jgi:hypothetical protein
MDGSPNARAGRVESGLNRELRTRPDVGPAERAALRVLAHALDVAETSGDWDGVARGSRIYLELRHAAGITATRRATKATNAPDWDGWLNGLSDAVRGDPTNGE